MNNKNKTVKAYVSEAISDVPYNCYSTTKTVRINAFEKVRLDGFWHAVGVGNDLASSLLYIKGFRPLAH